MDHRQRLDGSSTREHQHQGLERSIIRVLPVSLLQMTRDLQANFSSSLPASNSASNVLSLDQHKPSSCQTTPLDDLDRMISCPSD
jgi:hypothetical protein